MQTIILKFCEQFSKLHIIEWWPNIVTEGQSQNVDIYFSLKIFAKQLAYFCSFFPSLYLETHLAGEINSIICLTIVKTPSSPSLCSCIAWFYIFHSVQFNKICFISCGGYHMLFFATVTIWNAYPGFSLPLFGSETSWKTYSGCSLLILAIVTSCNAYNKLECLIRALFAFVWKCNKWNAYSGCSVYL